MEPSSAVEDSIDLTEMPDELGLEVPDLVGIRWKRVCDRGRLGSGEKGV